MNSHDMIEAAQFIFCKDNKQLIAVGKKEIIQKTVVR